MIVDERQQHRPDSAVCELGAVQTVPGPQLVAHPGFEAAIDLARRPAVRADVQSLAGEVGLHRPQPRHMVTLAGGGEHDLPHLRRGPLRPLTL
jgi:hypothetical protein